MTTPLHFEEHSYRRIHTVEVSVGDLKIGHFNPIRIQTMTTADTMDTMATVEETIRCIQAGAELVRITAPSKKEAENLLNIKNELYKRGYAIPLVADIHYTPNAAEIAARIVEKVRINPGNYIDKKKFEHLEYTNAEYLDEIERIRTRFLPLLSICKQYGTALRIGTNHGSLSDRIMSRYGDTANGMVESAMEFLRIAADENFHNIVLSMKSSNPLVMVEAYRLLVHNMQTELGYCYPLHLGVTEAGDGEDGRIKSAMGIGTLLEEGIGDTIRVSLTEDPEFELPVCRNIVQKYPQATHSSNESNEELLKRVSHITVMPKRSTESNQNIGGNHVPIVVADHSQHPISVHSLKSVGYQYIVDDDKWHLSDQAADYVYCGHQELDFDIPGTLRSIMNFETWKLKPRRENCFPIMSAEQYLEENRPITEMLWITITYKKTQNDFIHPSLIQQLVAHPNDVICLESESIFHFKECFKYLRKNELRNPVVIKIASAKLTTDEALIDFSIDVGSLLISGEADGIFLTTTHISSSLSFLNSCAFGILQASRRRISKTEYISCPSCGRTLFDLQDTTAKIRSVTNHLKGVKIAIMGCIVNGPGEMADADFGYVGSGPGKITLYKGKEVVKKNISAEIAVDELIDLLKSNNAWVEPPLVTL